jgi:hypothetical protein
MGVWTAFTVVPVRGSGRPRRMPLVTRMQEFQASRRGKTSGILECKLLSENAHRTLGCRHTRQETCIQALAAPPFSDVVSFNAVTESMVSEAGPLGQLPALQCCVTSSMQWQNPWFTHRVPCVYPSVLCDVINAVEESMVYTPSTVRVRLMQHEPF